jgi:hypothetical protein
MLLPPLRKLLLPRRLEQTVSLDQRSVFVDEMPRPVSGQHLSPVYRRAVRVHSWLQFINSGRQTLGENGTALLLNWGSGF